MIAALAALLGLAVVAPAGKQGPGGFNILSEEQEIELGRRAAAQVEQKLPMLGDRLVDGYVDSLGQPLVRHSLRKEIPYQFKVVDLGEANAFALPGGFVYINRGVLELADNESEAAGVLAHEISHIVAKHSARQASRAIVAQFGLQALGILLGGGAGAEAAQMAAAIGTQFYFLRFSREAEREADRLAVENMVRAGLDSIGMVTLFEELASLQKREPSKVEVFFSTHPSPRERMENVSGQIKSLGPRGGLRRDSRDFHQMKLRLAALPPPKQRSVSPEAEP